MGVHYSGLPGTRGISSYYGDGGFPLPIAARLPRGVGVHYSGLPVTPGISAYTPGHLPPQSRGHFQNRMRRHFPRPADAVRRAQPVFGVLPEVSLPPAPGVSSYYGSGSFPLPIAARLPRSMSGFRSDLRALGLIQSGSIDLSADIGPIGPAAVVSSAPGSQTIATQIPGGGTLYQYIDGTSMLVNPDGSVTKYDTQGNDVYSSTGIGAPTELGPPITTASEGTSAAGVPSQVPSHVPPAAPFSFNSLFAGNTMVGSTPISNGLLMAAGGVLVVALLAGGKRR